MPYATGLSFKAGASPASASATPGPGTALPRAPARRVRTRTRAGDRTSTTPGSRANGRSRAPWRRELVRMG
jgi:hypothetical protein